MRKLSTDEIESARQVFISPYLPEAPDEYINWLKENGCGKHESGYEIYSKPVDSAYIFGEMSQRCTGYFVVIGTKGWDAWIGFTPIADKNGWQFVFHDGYDFDVEEIAEGLEEYLKVNK